MWHHETFFPLPNVTVKTRVRACFLDVGEWKSVWIEMTERGAGLQKCVVTVVWVVRAGTHNQAKMSVILHNVAAVLLYMLRTGCSLRDCVHFAAVVVCIKLLIKEPECHQL